MYAYEWFDSSSRLATRRNPPFAQGTAGRLVPALSDEGISNRILRGFIRRAEYDAADAKSGARLYFMYNPEQITRDYVSYLDQGALDPFNTVFQSGNLVPPPSFMDFTFSLLFDRQEEAQSSRHPGVFVDYEFFDLVVRNITPVTNINDVSATLPDNGVMMVNPRDITVVFSPQITVQGRPSNARVNFQRFTHRMVPTRMQIDLTMRVTYFGPMKDMTTYPGEEAATAEKIPWDITSPSPFTITRAEIQESAGLFMEQMSANMLSPEDIKTMIALAEKANALSPGTGDRWLATGAANEGLNANIVDFALKMSNDYNTQYAKLGGPRNKLWTHADCSSFFWGAYAGYDPPYNTQMGPDMGVSFANGTSGRTGIPDATTECELARKGVIPCVMLWSTDSKNISERHKVIDAHIPELIKGDVIGRKKGIVDNKGVGHIAFIYSNDTAGKRVEVVDAASTEVGVGLRSMGYDTVGGKYTDAFRPLLGTPNSVDANPGG